VGALSEFGQTKTLASPRVHTLNNQKASLEFVTPLIYFSVERSDDGTDADGKAQYKYTSTKQEDEEGVKLDITPTIDRKRGEVTLTVIPELRNFVKNVPDPVNPGNEVPSIVRRKIETSLKIRSGDVMVIGGLIQERTNRIRRGIPYLKDVPVLGYLFGFNSFQKTLNETIIFIKATIVDEYEPLGERDKMMLDKFGGKN
jgi:general secretion pathway protein D